MRRLLIEEERYLPAEQALQCPPCARIATTQNSAVMLLGPRSICKMEDYARGSNR